MSQVRRRPQYNREWLEAKKAVWSKFIRERLLEAKRKGLIDKIAENFKPRTTEKDELMRLGFVDAAGELDVHDPNSDNDNIDPEDFYSDEDAEKTSDAYKNTGVGLKLNDYGSKRGAKGQVDEDGYFKRVLRHEPDINNWDKLVSKKEQYRPEKIKEKFEQDQQNSRNNK